MIQKINSLTEKKDDAYKSPRHGKSGLSARPNDAFRGLLLLDRYLITGRLSEDYLE